MTARQGRFAIFAALLLPALAVTALWACQESPAAMGDASTDAGDATLDSGDAGPMDAAADARPPRPDGTLYDFCHQPIFKLPIDGMTEITRGIDIWGSSVVYSKYLDEDYDQMNVHLFDIGQCAAFQLTWGPKIRASAPNIWGGITVWVDSRDNSREPYYCRDIFSYDLEMWEEFQLTNTPECKGEPKTNGRHIAFVRSTELRAYAPADFRLWDMETDDEIILAPAWGQVGYFDISDRYVVWSQYRGTSSSKGRDIVYYDLEAGELGWVPQSAEHYTYWVATSGDYLTYVSSDIYDWEPFSLHLYNVVTQEATVLAQDDPIFTGAFMQDNLVAYYSGSFAAPGDSRYHDAMIYDIRSGFYRRLTRESSLRLGASGIFFPYLLLAQGLGLGGSSNRPDYYIANLVELGVTDLGGNLIPGDPVLDSPPLPP